MGVVSPLYDFSADLVKQLMDRVYVLKSTCLDRELAIRYLILQSFRKNGRYSPILGEIAFAADDYDEHFALFVLEVLRPLGQLLKAVLVVDGVA